MVVGAGCCEWTCLQDLVEAAVNLEVLDFTKVGNLDAFDMLKVSLERENYPEEKDESFLCFLFQICIDVLKSCFCGN